MSPGILTLWRLFGLQATPKLTTHLRADLHLGGDGPGNGDLITGGAALRPEMTLTTTVTVDYWPEECSLPARNSADHDLGRMAEIISASGGGESDDLLLALNVIYKF